MKKEIIVLGDIELGAGNLTDDFISDKTLSQLILSLSKRKNPVDLILNGDTFDFLKCPYVRKGRKTFPRHITTEISLGKLRLIYQAHKPVFAALQKFVQSANHRLFFIIGNHDYDLLYKEVQQEIKRLLGNKSNKQSVFFRWLYRQHGVYAEHGQQYDFFNRINPHNYAFIYRGKSHLNLPWLSFAVISGYLSLKEQHPFLERIKPIPVLFSIHKEVKEKISTRSMRYFLKSIFYYPLRYFYDPTYSFPRRLFYEAYRRIKNVHWEVDGVVETFKKRKKRLLYANKIYVFSHIHKKYLEEKGGRVIIHPDTWRDEYTLDARSRILTPKRKRYVRIEVQDNNKLNYKLNNKLQWELVEVPIKRSTFHFNDVVKDETAFIKKAAEEEGYFGVGF